MQPTTYTPVSDPNATPAFGQSGPSVLALQKSLNQKYANTPGYQPLKEDSRYGIHTRDTFNGKPQLIVDSGPARADYANADAYYNQNLATKNNSQPTPAPESTGYSDAYTQQLDALGSRSDANTRSLLATISAQHANAVNKVDQNYDKYTRGLELLGVESGSAQATPELLKGQILEAKQQGLDKIHQLDAEESKAMIDAENARADKQMDVFKEKIDYIKQIKQDKANAIKDLAAGEDQYMQKATFYGPAIYQQLQGLNGTKRAAALEALSKELGIPSMYLVGAAAKAAPKPKVSSSHSSNNVSQKNAIANINKRLNNREKDASGYSIRGDDNYVDPSEYLNLYKQWSRAGLSDKVWNTNFPAKTFLNPASIGTLPKNLQPATTTKGKKS